MDKDVIYIMGYYSAIKNKNKNLSFAATRMDLEGIILRDLSQTEQDKHGMLSLVCGM